MIINTVLVLYKILPLTVLIGTLIFDDFKDFEEAEEFSEILVNIVERILSYFVSIIIFTLLCELFMMFYRK